MNVYIHKPVNYSDMQGPAPEGFHVPLITEWQGVKTIMDGLGLTTGDGWRINLHMPFGGFRSFDASINSQGSNGNYWSSSSDVPGYPYYARRFQIVSSIVYDNSDAGRSFGLAVRCFKDLFVTPTSSWTVITGTLGGAGIFWDKVNGLISITGDGTTGYTIQDKNLGATTVYSDGDTLSEANCGKYYQRGNNYGFAWAGSVTTSSTRVDASNYGPGNYYNSSTYITGNYDWSSVYNDNLRGGVSGLGGESELKNAYIGEYTGWEYSYDFRNKTESQLNNDGWIKVAGTLNTGSNGISSTTSTDVTVCRSIDLSNAKKITINYSVTPGRSASDKAFTYGIQKDSTSTGWQNAIQLYMVTNYVYGGTRVMITQSGSTTYGTNVGSISTSSSYTPTLIIDLENKLITGKVSGLSDSTLALTDSQVTEIRGWKFLRLYTTQNDYWIQTIDVLVEY